MKYVYILKSLVDPGERYIGITGDLNKRLRCHNTGQNKYSARFSPWRIDTYVVFSCEKKAAAFEKYLKSGSGRAFSKKRM